MSTAPEPLPEVIERGPGVLGGELVLRRAGRHYEVISNGMFLMDTRDGRSERELVRAGLAELPPGRAGLAVLVGGLGVGYSARAALDADRVAHVRVVEVEPRVVDWHRGVLGPVAGHVLADPRCVVECADIVTWLDAAAAGPTRRYDLVCLDVDNGPDWTVVRDNDRLYQPAALDRLAAVTSPGGVVAFWSAMRSPAFAALLERRFGAVRTVEVPARAGGPDVIYLARVAG